MKPVLFGRVPAGAISRSAPGNKWCCGAGVLKSGLQRHDSGVHRFDSGHAASEFIEETYESPLAPHVADRVVTDA